MQGRKEGEMKEGRMIMGKGHREAKIEKRKHDRVKGMQARNHLKQDREDGFV